jgi:hypothetical protein
MPNCVMLSLGSDALGCISESLLLFPHAKQKINGISITAKIIFTI